MSEVILCRKSGFVLRLQCFFHSTKLQNRLCHHSEMNLPFFCKHFHCKNTILHRIYYMPSVPGAVGVIISWTAASVSLFPICSYFYHLRWTRFQHFPNDLVIQTFNQHRDFLFLFNVVICLAFCNRYGHCWFIFINFSVVFALKHIFFMLFIHFKCFVRYKPCLI